MFTANSIVKQDGKLIMGAGCAKSVRDTYSGIDKMFGNKVVSIRNLKEKHMSDNNVIKHKINDVLYCLWGAHEEHNAHNHGNEREWLQKMYLEIDKLDNNYDLQEYTVKQNIELHKDKQPLAGEYWMCHLKQGACNRITIVYRMTDNLWDLPHEQMSVVWQQEDVTPLNRMIEEE
jgi:hypothetical protein